MDEKLSLTDLSRRESQMLRGIAILLVLLGHTEYIKWGGAGGVGIFLLLSGYGLNESVKSGGLKRYWYKRFRTVWLPYCSADTLNGHSWQEHMAKVCGFSPVILEPEPFEELPEVAAMPCYPDSGSLKVIDGTLVVKLSQPETAEE